jgi:PAS domain S-box-containing protein
MKIYEKLKVYFKNKPILATIFTFSLVIQVYLTQIIFREVYESALFLSFFILFAFSSLTFVFLIYQVLMREETFKNEKFLILENIFEKISENVPGMIYVFKKNVDGTIQFPYTSKGVNKIFGISQNELMANPHLSFKYHVEEDMPLLMKSIDESEKNLVPWTLEYRVNLPGLGERWLLGHSMPERQGDGSTVWYGNIFDITEQKKLSVKSSVLSSLVHSSKDAIIAYNLKGEIIDWNQGAEAIFSESSQEAIGKKITKFVPDFDLNYRLNANPNEILNRETVLKRNGNEDIHLEIIDSPIISKDGNLIGFSKIARDVSEKVATDKLLEEKNKYLLSASKLSALGEMAANMSHEINNPLAIITLKTQKLIKQLERKNVNLENFKNDLQNIFETSNRIASVVLTLKQFSRDSRLDPMETVNVESVLNEALLLCQERFKLHEIVIMVNVKNNIMIKCRANQLLQVILSFLMNAFNNICKQEERWIDITISESTNLGLIKIKDSGIIKEHNLNEYFLNSEKGHHSTSVGLGISIAKTVIENHNGRLYLDNSEFNPCFVIELPMQVALKKVA